jgi:hypothetical protein
MTILERIINRRSNSDILHIRWKEIDSITIEDVAYTMLCNVELDGQFYRTFERAYRSNSNSLNINVLNGFVDHENFINILILVTMINVGLYPDTVIYDQNYDYLINIQDLEEAWKYAVDNGLEYTKFGYAIISLGYKPPSSYKFDDWASRIHPRPVKSARKIDN